MVERADKQRLICHVLRPTGSERKGRFTWRRVSISNYASKNTPVCWRKRWAVVNELSAEIFSTSITSCFRFGFIHYSRFSLFLSTAYPRMFRFAYYIKCTLRLGRTTYFLRDSSLREIQQRFIHRLVARRETAEDHLKIGMGGQHGLHLANSDFRRITDGIAVHPGRDAGEGNRTAAVLDGDCQRVAVAPRELLRLTMLTVPIDGSDRVNHELGWQFEPWRNPRLARRASHPRAHLRHFETRLIEFSPCRPVDRAVNPAAAQHHLVRGIDDGIHRQLRDITLLNSYHGHSLKRRLPGPLGAASESPKGRCTQSLGCRRGTVSPTHDPPQSRLVQIKRMRQPGAHPRDHLLVATSVQITHTDYHLIEKDPLSPQPEVSSTL